METQTGVAMNVDQIIERLCLLQEEVANRHVGYDEGSDCFCGKGGYWKRDGYGGTPEQGYRNTGKALEFIESAVREKLDSMGTETQTGMTIYLLCEDCEDSWGNFTVLGWSHDKDLLTAECTRLENEKYQKERKIWDENGGEPNFGPIAPDDRQNGYRQYYVKEVGQWPTPNKDLVNKNEKLIMSEGSQEGREYCPVLNAHCKFYSYQCDSNGDVAISHCSHPDNINDREGNCTHTLCPL